MKRDSGSNWQTGVVARKTLFPVDIEPNPFPSLYWHSNTMDMSTTSQENTFFKIMKLLGGRIAGKKRI